MPPKHMQSHGVVDGDEIQAALVTAVDCMRVEVVDEAHLEYMQYNKDEDEN